MPAPTIAQIVLGNTTFQRDRDPITLPGVVAGRCIVLTLQQSSGTLRSYTVSDSAGNTWTNRVNVNYSSRVFQIWTTLANATGSLTINVAASGNNDALLVGFELAGVDTTNLASLVQAGSFQVASGPTEYCAEAPGITSPREGIFIGGNAPAVSRQTYFADSSIVYVVGVAGADQAKMLGYRIDSAGVSNERFPIIQSVYNSRPHPAGLIWLPGTSSAGATLRSRGIAAGGSLGRRGILTSGRL